MAAAGARAFKDRGKTEAMTSIHERESIVLPPGLVEVDRKQETRLVQEQRIHARDERLPLGILARQVPPNDIVCDGQKPSVGTIGAFDAWLLADTLDPLVRASGRITRSASFAALESARVDIFSATEK